MQGIIGVVVANIDVLAGMVVLDPAIRAIVVALVMAIFSPIMAMLGGGDSVYIEGGAE